MSRRGLGKEYFRKITLICKVDGSQKRVKVAERQFQ
jgi:hypothetical protein